jgi:ParB-like chromosome segregation protein Spo0J
MNEITTVRLEDVHRRENARELDMKLVGEIAESIRTLGFKPQKSITIRKDGDIYWIVDGGHRAEAAMAVGLEEVPATIEILDDAGVLTYEGSLNLQRPDTEEERWARAQEFMALGDAATPQQIAVATGVSIEDQRKAFRVLRKLADPVAAEDVRLDQALAAHAFIDDDEAYERVINAGRNWEQVARDIETERKALVAKAEAFEMLAERGIEATDGTKGRPQGMQYVCQRPISMDPPEGATHAFINMYGAQAHVEYWRPYAEPVVDAEAEAKREAAERARAEYIAERDASALRRFEWVKSYLKQVEAVLPSVELTSVLASLLTDEAYAEYDDYTVDRDIITAVMPDEPSAVARVYAALVSVVENHCYLNTATLHMAFDTYEAMLAVSYLNAIDASGYDLTDWEAAYYASAQAVVREAEEAAEAEGDES